MRNQPFSSLTPASDDAAPVDPRRRVLWLGLGLCAALVVIGARMVHVQSVLAPRYVQPWREGMVSESPIPARDGRIVTRDGVILAQSETRYNVAVDYRRLETPPDAGWVRQQVAKELSKADRRDPAKRQAVLDRLASQREQLLTELARAAGVPREELFARAAEVQQRVEKIVAAVEQRREGSRQEQETEDWSPESGWRGLVQLFVDELTTPPNRFAADPVIVKEELADHVLLTHVPLAAAAEIQSRPAAFPGVRVRDVTARAYPRGDLAANLIGVRRPSPVDGNPDRITGEAGIELAYDRTLTGTPGSLHIERNRRHEIIQREESLPPRDGQDVQLTIDSRLQQLAETLLDEAALESRGGCLVALDVWTGEVLALAGSPRVAPSILAHPTRAQWEELLADPRQPLFPRELQMALPPGDLFKLVTAAAALESGRVSPSDTLFCRGYLARPDQHRCAIYQLSGAGHGDVRLTDALCQSCNVYFFELAQRISAEELCLWAERFGLGQPTGIDLPREASGKLPQAGTLPDHPESRKRALLQLAIGQGGVLATPLQFARLTAALGNGGTLLTPRIVTEQASELPTQSKQQIDGLHPRTLQALRDGLLASATHPLGNAREAGIEMLTIAGMAGTAAVADRPPHAWFAGYAPAEQPRVAVVVALEQGGEAGRAARIARDFLTEMLGVGELRPAPADWRDSQELRRAVDPLARSGETGILR